MTLGLERRRIVVVCGAGGVGKTTVAASVATALARSGRRTIVMAVDPAKRLATSLGLPKTPGERSTVDAGQGATMEALLLDTKRTFDELVERHAASPERRDRILSNRFYQRIASTLSGTYEYMAMERLYELATTEDWEAVVIDTPPTRSALSFLDAPRRLTDFLGGKMFRWLLWPTRGAGRAGMRGASMGARLLSATVGRIAGAELLSDTAEFLSAFEGMYDGFKQRAASVHALLSEEQTGFVVVTAPERASLDEAGHFVQRLTSSDMHLSGVVVNRWVEAPSLTAAPGVVERLAPGSPPERAAAACLEIGERLRAVEARGRAAVKPFASAYPEVPLTYVPELPLDVHDRAGLDRMAAHLFG
ncbi:MAG: AAA family ATPase [Actinomycetota bacterium]|nr:AAA family ATPase [Actinomycetota bacterium]